VRVCVRVIDGARVPLRETCMHVRCAFAHSWNALANVHPQARKAQGPPCAGVLVRVGMSVRAPRRPGARGLRVALGALGLSYAGGLQTLLWPSLLKVAGPRSLALAAQAGQRRRG
jgi:hypothetical protein